MNKIISAFTTSFLTICILIQISGLNTYAQTTFSDVEGNAFEEHIYALAELEVINGFSDGTFRPNNYSTRGEITKFVVRAFELEIDEELPNRFSDVDTSNKFYNEINLLSSSGIINGFSDGTFKPNNPVTRGQAMKIIVNAVKFVNEDRFTTSTQIQLFSDVDNTNAFMEQINSAASIRLDDDSRIINGYSDKRFGVDEFITRGAVSKIINQSITYLNDGGEFDPPSPYSATPSEHDIGNYEFELIAVYEVDGEDISLIQLEEGEEIPEYSDMWDHIVDTIPNNARTVISKYSIVTDGKGELAAAVQRDFDDLENDWVLMIDIEDFFDGDSVDYTLLEYVIVHEIAHTLTLSGDQLDISENLYNTNLTEEQFRQRQAENAANCPTYYASDGCAIVDAYISEFYFDFWTDIYSDWRNLDNEDFYDEYEDQFVNEYAATSVEEDIAESFTFFVFSNKPSTNSTDISDRKILFFYEFGELVELRQSILANID